MAPLATNIAPWLAVRDAEAAMHFYELAFDATETYRLDADGGLEVAQLSIDGALFWIQKEAAGIDPSPSPIRLILSVEDPDGTFERAVAAGAVVVSPVSEAHGWRTGRLTDPFGHDWEISRHVDPA